MSRRWTIVAVVALLGTLLGACGKREDGEDQLRAALRKTARAPRGLTYTEVLPATKLQQRVLLEVEDDFRYKARFVLQGRNAIDEVARDDALALRALDSSGLALFLKKEAVAATPASTSGGPTAVEALNAGRWVLDPVGAPSTLRSTKEKVVLGADPIRDAIAVLTYLDRVIDDSAGVARFNPDSLDPAYKAKEDPFPQPPKGSGIVRYDLRPPKFPSRASSTGTNQVIPTDSHFRKLAVYVDRDGYIVEIREDIDVASKLDDLAKTYDIDFPEDQTAIEQAQFAIDVINTVLKGQGGTAIRMRTLDVRFRDVGKPVSVELPTADVIEGDLSILRDRGRVAPGDANGEAADEAATSATSTSTTTP